MTNISLTEFANKIQKKKRISFARRSRVSI